MLGFRSEFFIYIDKKGLLINQTLIRDLINIYYIYTNLYLDQPLPWCFWWICFLIGWHTHTPVNIYILHFCLLQLYKQHPKPVHADAKSWMLHRFWHQSNIASMMGRAECTSELADTSLTSNQRQPMLLVLPWATHHPSASFNSLWLKEKSRFAEERKLFLKTAVWHSFHTLQKTAWE